MHAGLACEASPPTMAPTTAVTASMALLATALPAALAEREIVGSTVAAKRCSQPPDGGPCDGDFRRYFFEPSLGCQPFKYGGCGGNSNNFETIAECEEACAGAGLPVRTMHARTLMSSCMIMHRGAQPGALRPSLHT